MARSQAELQEVFEAIGGSVFPGEVYPGSTLFPAGASFAVYFQPPPRMEYPCIKYERDESWVSRADNLMYLFKKRYQVTVIDRDPDSAIPDMVEALPFTRFQRFFPKDGLNHWVFSLYF